LTPQTTTDWTVELDSTGFTGSRRPTPAARPSACAVRVPRPCLGLVTAPPPSRWRGRRCCLWWPVHVSVGPLRTPCNVLFTGLPGVGSARVISASGTGRHLQLAIRRPCRLAGPMLDGSRDYGAGFDPVSFQLPACTPTTAAA
jgi:hypothetical protein